jgi:hypothetical protein
MKKSTVFVGALFLSVFLATPAFPWGWTVHTYIDEQFTTKWRLQNANQVYGGLAPDLFNFRFDAPEYRGYLQDRTHNDFMPVWNAAKSKPAKALAFGFVSHNEVWGIDSTAHRAGITFGQQTGYVIAKAYALMAILNQVPEFWALQLPEPVVLTVAHELVERGVDLLMEKLDPMIGLKLAAAALPPNPNFPLLMEKAYAADLATHFGISRIEAVKFIKSSERQFRQTMILYGHVLMQDDATAIALMAEQLEEMAKAFLAAVGLPPLPDGVDIQPLLKFGIEYAMSLCAGDFEAEVEATVDYVEHQLRAHGISYGVAGR